MQVDTNTAAIGQYLDLLNKVIRLISASVPLVVLVLRRIRWLPPKPSEPPNAGSLAAGVIGFGCLGSITGLFLTVVFTVGIIIFIGLKFLDAQPYGSIGLESINPGIAGELFSKTNLIFVSASIVSTLLEFGGKDRPSGLAFLAGVFLGVGLALMFLLSLFLH